VASANNGKETADARRVNSLRRRLPLILLFELVKDDAIFNRIVVVLVMPACGSGALAFASRFLLVICRGQRGKVSARDVWTNSFVRDLKKNPACVS
jgi:hypothetical protein